MEAYKPTTHSVKTLLEALMRLQNFDMEIRTLQGNENSSTFLIEMKSQLEAFKIRESEKCSTFGRLRDLRNKVNAELEGSRARIVKNEAHLKKVRSPAEFQSTLKELEQLRLLEESLEMNSRSLGKDLVLIENEMLELRQKIASIEKQIGTVSIPILNENDSGKVLKTRDLRDAVKMEIPPAYYSLYQRVAQARDGLAVVKVQGKICGGCHLLLPPQFLNDLNKNTTIHQCPSCKRILSQPEILQSFHV